MYVGGSSSSVSPTPAQPLSRAALTSYYKSYVTSQKHAGKNDEHVQRRQRLYTSSEPSSMLRIASYNIHFHSPYDNGEEEGEAFMKRAIAEIDADVLCLQEICRPHKVLSQDTHPHVHFHQLFTSFGNAIASRYPLKDIVTHVFPRSAYDDRGLMGATIDHPLVGLIRVYNTHLDVFDETGQTRLIQAQSIDRLIEGDIKRLNLTKIPILLMGDFNAVHPSSYANDAKHWKWIIEQDQSRQVVTKTAAMDHLLSADNNVWKDIFSENSPTVTTWSLRRIDYILMHTSMLLSKHIKMKTWQHFDVASDHLPVGVDLIVDNE